MIDEEANLLLLSADQTTLFKYLASYHYDSVLTFKRNGTFFPDFTLTNRQQIFLLDALNQELVILSKDLRFISSYPYSLWNLENPQRIAVTGQGDIFLYEPESKTIARIDNLFKLLTFFSLPPQIQVNQFKSFHSYKDHLFLATDSVLYVLSGRGWFETQHPLSCSASWFSFHGEMGLYSCGAIEELHLVTLVPFQDRPLFLPSGADSCLKSSKFAIPYQKRIFLFTESQIVIME